jgi:hypothetical protein
MSPPSEGFFGRFWWKRFANRPYDGLRNRGFNLQGIPGQVKRSINKYTEAWSLLQIPRF